MNSEQRVRFGLVGAGRISQAYIPAFADSENACLVAVADVRHEAAQALAEPVGAECYASYQELAEHPDLDAIVICTPPATHPEIALYTLEREIHVLCEKPVSIDPADARQLAEAAEKHGVKFTMASKFRFVPDVVRAKSIIESGLLGQIVLFENIFTAPTDMVDRWNSSPTVSGGGVLIDNGTHSVDIMNYLVGKPVQILAVEGDPVQRLSVEETVHVLARTTSGVLGSIQLSWSLDVKADDYIRVHGSEGTLRVGWKGAAYQQFGKAEWVTFGKGYDKTVAFRNQIDNFARAVRDGEDLRVPPADAVASTEVIAAAYRSLRKNSWESVPVNGLRKVDATSAA